MASLILGAIGSKIAGENIVISNARYIAILNTSSNPITITQVGRGSFVLPANLGYTFPYDANRYYSETTITAGTGAFIYDWQP
jgi:hypothetical protein